MKHTQRQYRKKTTPTIKKKIQTRIIQKQKNHQKGGEQYLVDFETMKNTGRTDGMSNQCFWISLCDFLNHYLDIEEKITVKKLRALIESQNLPINCQTEMFDYESHKKALEYISEMYHLKITIYDVDDKNKIDIIERNTTFGVENGIPIHIAFYPYGHFELITTIDGATVLPSKVDVEENIKQNVKKNTPKNKTQKIKKKTPTSTNPTNTPLKN